MDEQSKLKKIEFYKSALFSAERQIEIEKAGLILDSGRILPHVVNNATIMKLQNEIAEYKQKIVELQR